jgi:pyruvate formate lyase activating enzyme
MIITSLQKTSLIDYPGRIASVIFTQGCNLRCSYCHNPQLLDRQSKSAYLTKTEVFKILEKRKKIIEGVVVTGGEPTIHSDLADFILELKNLGFSIKLDTNGTHPVMLQKLLNSRLLDFVALDVKASPSLYNTICRRPVDTAKITTCIKLLKISAINHEFRTTLTRKLSIYELKIIQEWLGDTNHWILQKCRPVQDLNNDISTAQNLTMNLLYEHFPNCKLRGF